MSEAKRPVILIILDGFGWREDSTDNAARLAHMPNLEKLLETAPHSLLEASGEAVGLPDGQIGNSEVGHLTLGCGRKVMQILPRITQALSSGDISKLPGLKKFFNSLKETKGTCHLMGLLSPGGVHSHSAHILALAKLAIKEGVPVDLHLFTDGRDTAPTSAELFLSEFSKQLPSEAHIATISGRYYAMDRDNRWERVQKAYEVMAHAKGEHFPSAQACIEHAYANDITDEFVIPAVIGDYKGMKSGDGILSANFRSDRVLEILDALIMPEFNEFPRGEKIELIQTCAMTRYSDHLADYLNVLFPKDELPDLLGELIEKAGLKQLRIAETEKFPHVTYFFNGGVERQYEGEDRILVPSPKVATYDLQPAMSAEEVASKTAHAVLSKKYDLIILNFANPDMVGHTGSLKAAQEACEAVDKGLGEILTALQEVGGVGLITADHGNCEVMKNPETGEPHTAHTTNQVPFILANADHGQSLSNGTLADVAPTILHLLGLSQPKSMTGRNLVS